MANRSTFSHYRSYTTQKRNRKRILRIVLTIFLVYYGYLFVNAEFLRTVLWQSTTMEPTLKSGDAVLVTPLPLGTNNLPFLPFGLPGWRGPERGELVLVVPAYHTPASPWLSAADELIRFVTFNQVSLEKNLSKPWDQAYTLRRVIALPGDTVRLDNFTASVKPAGKPYFLSEYELSKKIYSLKDSALPDSWRPSFPLSGTQTEITLGRDEYFVLADNRSQASDSRTWGVVKRNAIKGIALLKYWPLSDFGGL